MLKNRRSTTYTEIPLSDKTSIAFNVLFDAVCSIFVGINLVSYEPYMMLANALPVAVCLSARIVAVADVYEALTSDRVCKKALSHTEALSILAKCQADSSTLGSSGRSAPWTRQTAPRSLFHKSAAARPPAKPAGTFQLPSVSTRVLARA